MPAPCLCTSSNLLVECDGQRQPQCAVCKIYHKVPVIIKREEKEVGTFAGQAACMGPQHARMPRGGRPMLERGSEHALKTAHDVMIRRHLTIRTRSPRVNTHERKSQRTCRPHGRHPQSMPVLKRLSPKCSMSASDALETCNVQPVTTPMIHQLANAMMDPMCMQSPRPRKPSPLDQQRGNHNGQQHQLCGHCDWPHDELALIRNTIIYGSMPQSWGRWGYACIFQYA